LHEQEKVTRLPGWQTEKHTDVCRLSRNAEKRNGFRRNDEAEASPEPTNRRYFSHR
jgi:hypothetical protein